MNGHLSGGISLNRHSRTARATGAALAATTAFGFFAPAAHAAPAKAGTHVTTERSTRSLSLVSRQAPAGPASHVIASKQASVLKQAPTAPAATSYVVQSGDTLWGIARKHNSSVAAIANANGIKNTNYLRIGQKLTIPGATQASTSSSSTSKPASTATTSTTRHVVVSGETLSSIAKKYGTTSGALQQANSLSNPNRIYVGQVLTIGGTSTTSSATTSTPSSSASKPASTATTSTTRHVVASGETLSSIAKKYGTTSGALQQANSLSNPNRIYVGQVLTIGGASTSSSSSVGNTFLGYTYSESTTSAANANKNALTSSSVPSRAEMKQIVRQTAIKMGVDPTLALAHAQVESGFDQSAVSPANAVGVMQVIPSSGVWASQLVGRNLNLLDPYDNVTAGVAIIKWLQANASSKDQGIAGYYQGLGGVRKYGMYPDTQSYVAKVKAAQANY